MIRNIWKARELLYCLVRRDMIVRYQSSVLGFLWSFAKPLALVIIFYVAFGIVMPISRETGQVNFALHLLVSIMVWSFLARSVTEAHWAVLSHSNLIKKIRLSVEVFPAVTVVGNLINFLLGMLIVYPIILILLSGSQGISVSRIVLQLVGLIFLTLLMMALAFALSLIVSAINVFYRDAESLSEVLLQAWFYATPTIYPITLFYTSHGSAGPLFGGTRLPHWIEYVYWLNPMTPICVAFRRVLLYRPLSGRNDLLFGGLEVPDGELLFFLGGSVVTTVILYFVAKLIFQHYARSFADEV